VREDAIVIVDHRPEWAADFAREALRLTPAMQPVLAHPIEHIGSTAIPGLAAKPIIDMVAVVVDVGSVAAVEGAVQGLGWVAAPEPGDEAQRRRSYCFPSVARRTHHLHVVEQRSPGWRGWIAFRNHLRAHPELAAEYGARKRDLAARFGADPNDRDAYRGGKADWIREVTAAALGTD
jgi:GrpB-like predicted nucleotidyltransferase (UPF0157 family)